MLCLSCSAISANDGIDKILSVIEVNNTELKASLSSLKSDSIGLRTTNNLEDPKVDFEYNFGEVGDKWGIGVSQGFDWPGIYSARGKANKSRIAAMRQVYNAKQLDVLLKAKSVCLNIIMLNRQIALQESIYNSIDELYAHYNKAYEHGEVSIIDINKIKIERISTKQQLDELKTQFALLEEDLVGLNNNVQFSGIDLKSLTDYPVEELYSFDTYVDDFNSTDPQQGYYAKMDEAISSEISVAKMGWLPKFDIGYQYTNELGDAFNGVTFGASIPIFSNKKKVASMKAQAVANELTQQDYATANISRLKAQYAQAVSLKSQLVSYSDVIGDDSNFVLLKKALDGGQISLLNYLLELRYFLEAKNKYIELEYNYNSVLAELNKYHILDN